ncbi:MAG: ribonuclease E/G [Clostridia bacterium]|nr:ribonuclease E/G [Clostridia bacterium]
MPDGLILVKTAGEKTLVAFLQDGMLMEYHQQDDSSESLVGAIFLGRVERVLPQVKAAFVKLGLKQNGFLPIREQEGYHQLMGDSPLITGTDVLVQVKKDPKGDKGAFLTRDVALPGQYVLLMPNNRHIGVSKRIEDESDRAAAKALGKKLADGRFGLIVRHAALFARESDIRDEAEALYEGWKSLADSAPFRKAPELLHTPDSPLSALVRDYSARYNLTVLADGDIPGAERIPPEEMDLLWRRSKVEHQLKQALGRKVDTPGGGNLMIDQREALHTIDVNSASNVETRDGMSLPLSQNLSAVSEIARQIRLRNLSGIVLVDFIDMDTEAERQAVLAAMEDAVRDDRVKTVIHGFTRLGILEMTRKRTSDTLLEMMSAPCKHCGGCGHFPL